MIQPRTLKGFRDFPPAVAIPREALIETAKATYRSFGFSPIDTPVLELTEILLGKGSDETDKQMYRFEDPGGRDVAMRFDLTIPFARFVAQNAGELGMPFKRYHVGPVWRGENTQRGRYREFLQCDFDTIGTENVMADTECALVICELFNRIGFTDRFTMHLNNRRVLSGVLEQLDLADQAVPVLRALDKLAKIGPEKVVEEMARTAGASASQADGVLALARLEGSNAKVLEALGPIVGDSELGRSGIEALGAVLAGVAAAGVPEGRVRLDVSIARGLDYYTGTVYETFLDDLPGIGSCCSGGRYDDLASLYTKERLPGVGASLGLDRVLAAMEELGMLGSTTTTAAVFIPYFDKDRGADYLRLATELRKAGLAVELYPEPRKLGAQLKYADRRGHRLAVIVGGDEFAQGTCQLKDLARKTSEELAQADLAAACASVLASQPTAGS
ncbi:MAG: histidine--tRNA ligase [bacterium]|nr:histidine--tRNA ligase [bacterium]